VADRLHISKSDILDPESSDAAVKLALAETHVIQETKTYLESHGVILSAFSSRGHSETIILVKNIPYGTTAEQLREMFGAHGELLRVLLPPAGTLGVIEFAHADEARKAFRALAYRRLGDSIIYLEKGPLGMFQPTSTSFQVADGVTPIAIEDPDAGGDDINTDITSGKTLFVKNLAFATTSERFAQAFRHLPAFAFARLQTKTDPKRPGSRLSMGFGFVGFRTTEAAQKAIKGMHGYVLDGHTLSVKFARRGAEEQEEKGGREKAKTTKMLVKNVPFEATRKDIQSLFGFVASSLLRAPRSANAIFDFRQCSRSAQVRPLAEALRPSLARVCVPRVRHATRGGKRIQRAQAHTSTGTPPRIGVGGGGRGEYRRVAQKGWRRCW